MGVPELLAHYRTRLQVRVATGPEGIVRVVTEAGASGAAGAAAVNEYRADRNHGLQDRLDFIPFPG